MTDSPQSIRDLPPHSMEAEQGVLGCCLQDSQKVDDALQYAANPEWFYDLRHRQLFTAIVAMVEEGVGIDMITVGQRMKGSGTLDEVGGLSYLSELMDKVPSTANLPWYLETLKDMFIRRRLTSAIADGASRVRNENFKAQEILVGIEAAIDGCRIGNAEAESIGAKAAAGSVVDTLQERAALAKEKGGGVTGVPTGFRMLDRMTAGFQRGELSLVAARPGVGKSAILGNFIRSASVDNGIPSLVITAEMSVEQVTRRLACEMASVDGRIVRNGDIVNVPSYAGEQRRFVSAIAKISKAPIYTRYVKGMSVEEIGAVIRSHVRKYGVGFVTVDYVQLIRPMNSTGSRAYDVGEVAEALKDFAVRNNVPIVAAAQLNRESEKGTRTPGLHDLKDSGQLEQAGEMILLIHRDLKESPTEAIVDLAKQREGEIGMIPMGYIPQFCRFTEQAVVPA